MKNRYNIWHRENLGKAQKAFGRSAPKRPVQAQGRGSSMVKKSAPSLADGPKPPWVTGRAVKREAFRLRWQRESRSAESARPKLTREQRALRIRKAHRKAAAKGLSR